MPYINVKGGTHAGWKRQYEPKPWDCSCGKAQKAYSCPDCGDRRP